ncbi:ATP-dependent DNA ligase [Mycetocola zhadangensis]|uniref:DNA ligase (ATP) n=1 Tax=Mycetocola zhadangensis TaxID=1164595 RepID=A0A3L7J6K8_9MICO|nr:ATP-dependent DNA ligase [Mycetocola zhadangensis]RLQ86337.1 ATP-dependent DNA ligase [Mycetocola zhadangensis]GGE90308.1 DNA ligase C1 [Mycetocola zhadangensis]
MELSPASPVSPQLAKAIGAVPEPDSVDGGLSYEPKWDGFRAIIYFDGENVEIGSRGSKMLTRYFPELTDAFRRLLPGPCVLDGEIVVPQGAEGSQKLDWEALSQRIHPAASRVNLLAETTPAMFVAFDLLSQADEVLLDAPFSRRRSMLDDLFGALPHPLHVTTTTTDVDLARRWLVEFEGAGLDGVVAKPLNAAYAPGKRLMLKIKHHRTADAVVVGYRVHKSGNGVGSLLLGLYTDDGVLLNVGGASAFSNARRLELIDELAPLVKRDTDGEIVSAETDRSRFSGSKDVSYVPLEPTRVLEVQYDQMEGMRFRHTVQFERWRPDREATSCTFDQLDRPIAYDLDDVLV